MPLRIEGGTLMGSVPTRMAGTIPSRIKSLTVTARVGNETDTGGTLMGSVPTRMAGTIPSRTKGLTVTARVGNETDTGGTPEIFVAG